jgi:hypothetical protein
VLVQAGQDFVERIETHNNKRKRHFEDAKARGLKCLPSSLMEPLDADSFAKDFALDVVTHALFSKDLRIQKGDTQGFAAAMEKIIDEFMAVMLNPLFWLVHPIRYYKFTRLVGWFQGFCLK